MKKLFLLLSISASLIACDKLNKADDAMNDVSQVNDKMTVLSRDIGKTNEAIRLQKMAVCLDQMQSEYALDRIFPVPTGLMACAKVFAEAATAQEVTDLIFVKIKEIDEVAPIKSAGEDGLETEDSLERQNKTMFEKFRTRQMLYAISGFLPESTVDAIIDHERFGGSRRPTMLNILMMRALFVQQVMVEDQYLKTDFETVGQATAVVQEMTKVEKILRLPFRDELFIKTTGILTPDIYDGPIANADVKMSKETLQALTASWSKIANYAEEKLVVSLRNDSDSQGQNEANFRKEQAQQQEVIKTARAYAKGWESVNP